MVRSNECHICRESLKRSRRGVRQYCDHPYHAKCLTEWSQKNPNWNGKCFYCFATIDLARVTPTQPRLGFINQANMFHCHRCLRNYTSCLCAAPPMPRYGTSAKQVFCTFFALGLAAFLLFFMTWALTSENDPSHLHPIDVAIIQWLSSWTLFEWAICLLLCLVCALIPFALVLFARDRVQQHSFSMNNVLHL